MHGRIVHPHAPFHRKRDLDVLRQPPIDAEVEIVHVSAPIPGRGNDAVRPAKRLVILFLIIQEICGKFPRDAVLVPEHQKPRRRGVLLPVSADADRAEPQEKVLVVQRFPDVVRARKMHALAVAVDAFGVEYRQIHLLQDEHIRRADGRVAHHRAVFLLRAAIIALAVAAVCSRDGVSVYVYGAVTSGGAGNIDDDDILPVDGLNVHVLVRQNIDADFFRIVDDVPKLVDQRRGVWQPAVCDAETFVRRLFDAEQKKGTPLCKAPLSSIKMKLYFYAAV